MLLLMVIEVLITKVMSNNSISAILVPLSVILGYCTGSADWNLCNTFSYSMFPVFQVPHGRSNCCNGIWTGYVKIKEISRQ